MGETTTVTKQTPETKRGDRKTNINEVTVRSRQRKKQGPGVGMWGFLWLLCTPSILN